MACFPNPISKNQNVQYMFSNINPWVHEVGLLDPCTESKFLTFKSIRTSILRTEDFLVEN
jgi:hypothetical protein